MGIVQQRLERPWRTDPEKDLENEVAGVEITSSGSIELHTVDVICSTGLSGATEGDIAVVVQRMRPVVDGFRDTAIAAWGDP